jgi:hypothetical protein
MLISTFMSTTREDRQASEKLGEPLGVNGHNV